MLEKLDITYLYYIPFVLSAILSLKSFWLKWPKHLRTFSIYLWFTLLIEILGNIWKWEVFRVFGSSMHNIWILNIGMIVGRAIMLLYFSQLLKSARLKGVIIKLIPLYLVFGVINYFFIQSPSLVNVYSISLGSIVVVFLCNYYFIELMNANYIVKLYKLPEFWLALGTFIYYLASIPLIIGFDFIVRGQNAPHLIETFMQYNDDLLFSMFTLYLIAYLCRPHPKLLYIQSSYPR
jgi:hypothetical protein